MNFYQLISLVLSLVTLVLSSNQKILKWPLGILANIIAINVYISSGLYIKTLLSLFFVYNSFYGMINWSFGGKNFTTLKVTKLKKKIFLKSILYCSIISFSVGATFFIFTGNKVSIAESISIFSIFAHILLSKKKIETWIVWFVIDFVLIFVCLYKGIYIFAFKYFIYLFLAAYSFYKWEKDL